MGCYGEIAILLSPEVNKQFIGFTSKHIDKEVQQLPTFNVLIRENKETGSKLYKWDFLSHYLIDDIINFLETLDYDLYKYIYIIDEYDEIKEDGSYFDDKLIMYPVTYIHIEDKE